LSIESLPELSTILRVIVALFVVVDPIGTIPLFMGLTHDMNTANRKKVSRVAVITASILLLIFALTGQLLLALFGISINSFKIAGGALLLILAVKILISGTWDEKILSPEETGAVPFAFPLLAGPGAITTTIVLLQISGLIAVLLGVVTVMLLTYIVLHFVDTIHGFIGRIGSAVVARLMAIFIAAIAFQFVIEGIKFYFP
jgi:multiple antibiotic resistance protein